MLSSVVAVDASKMPMLWRSTRSFRLSFPPLLVFCPNPNKRLVLRSGIVKMFAVYLTTGNLERISSNTLFGTCSAAVSSVQPFALRLRFRPCFVVCSR